MTSHLPSVSVVLPCYQAEKFVARAFHSVVNQTIGVRELICVDDGSTDNTLKKLEQLAEASSLPCQIVSSDHRGAAIARNTGLERATGEYIQFLDADDELLPRKLEEQLQIARCESNCDLVAGGYLWKRLVGLPVYRGPEFPDRWASLISTRLGITSANLWNRESVIAAGRWDEHRLSSQEYELMFRMLRNGASVGYSHKPLAFKHEVPSSITRPIGMSNEQRLGNLMRIVNLRIEIAQHLKRVGLFEAELREHYFFDLHQRLKLVLRFDPEEALRIHREEIPEDFCTRGFDGDNPKLIDQMTAQMELHGVEQPSQSVEYRYR